MNENVVVEKMNLVLEAAGLNTKLYSFDQLAQGAPILFINAFEPLFEHGIRNLNNSPNNLAEHEKNCDLLLDEMRRKVEPDRLIKTSGRKLVSGDRHTISTLVDIYCERSEYMRTRFDEYLSAPPKVIHPKHRLLKKDSSKKSAAAAPQEAADRPAENPVEVIQNLQQYVAALEQKLQSYESDGGKKPDSKKKRRGSKEPARGRKAADVERARQDAELGIDEDESESVTRGQSRERPRERPRAQSRERPKSGLRSGSAKTRPKRPSSAPAKRAPVASGAGADAEMQVQPGGRAGGGLASASAHEKPPSASPQRKNRPWSSAPFRPPPPQFLYVKADPDSPPAAAPEQPSEAREPFDPSIHTFDLRSGRRILIVDAERYKAKNEANGIVKEMDDFKDHNNPRSSAERGDGEWQPPEPTKPEWPGARTERSVREYLQKSKVARVGPEKPPPGSLPAARLLSAYSDLQDLDMLVTVEHCVNCQYHNTTLRHDEDQYRSEADNVLKSIAASIHEYNPCIRLGVLRFAANITPKCRDSDTDSRIGAFEVQVGFRNMFGDLTREMLHSKLSSRRWPSKSVTQKRLSAFLSKAKVAQHKEPGPSDHYEVDSEETGYTTATCPIGIGHWSELQIAGQAWTYVNANGEPAPPPRSPPRGKPRNQAGGVAEAAAETEGASIEWIFDARHVGEQALFSNGDEVWVSKFGGERHPLLGSVVKADGRNAALERVVTVQLNYVDTSVVVPESHCESKDSFAHDLPQWGADDVPAQLLTLFTYGKGTFRWHSRDETDATIKTPGGHHQHLLCRKSIFQQLKELVMAVEKAKRSRGTFLVPNVKVGQPAVDLQLCYCEPMLDWICAQSPNAEGQVNIEELVERIVPTPPPSPQKSPVAPKLSPREPTEKPPERQSPRSASKAAEQRSPKAESAQPPAGADSSAPAARENAEKTPQLRPIETNAAPAASPRLEEEEAAPAALVAGSVRTFVQELLSWCDRESGKGGEELSPRAKLKRNTAHLKNLFVADGSDGETRSLDVIQFSLALEALGLVCSTDVLMGLLATFDDDGNGQLQYDELVAFLEDESPTKFSLGDIWSNIRAVLISEVDGRKVHKIGELGQDMLSGCADGEEEVEEAHFTQVLEKYGLVGANAISKADLKMLVSRFAGKRGSSLFSSSKSVDVGKFLAWLNPVDVHRTSKRLAKSIDWYASRQTVSKTRKDVVDKVVAALLPSGGESRPPTAGELASLVAVNTLLETMYSFQIPMSRAEGRAFSKYFKHPNGDQLRVYECAAILMGDLLVLLEAEPVVDAPPAKNQTKTEQSDPFAFSGEFDSSPRKGITTVDSNNFDANSSFDQDGDQMGTPHAGGHGSALDVCVDMLEISGPALLKQYFDRTGVVLSCGNSTVKTAFSSARQKGTDSRLLDVKGKHILHLELSGNANPVLKAELFAMEDEEEPKLCGGTEHGLAEEINLYRNKSSDESGSSKIAFSVSTGQGTVNISANVHFVESKSSVASRIRKMSSKDLGEFRFQPLSNELEDDEDSDSHIGSQMPMAFSFGLSSLDKMDTIGSEKDIPNDDK